VDGRLFDDGTASMLGRDFCFATTPEQMGAAGIKDLIQHVDFIDMT
jgi:hypothetical protein